MTGTAQLGRYTVRDVNIWDVPDLFQLFSDEGTTRYLGVPRMTEQREAYELVQNYALSQTRWLTVLEGTKFLGVVGLEIQRHQATIFIAFNRIRRGVGREFSVPFVQYVFTHPQIWRVWAYVHVDNTPAQRVLERMGATREGRMRRFEIFPNVGPEPQDVYMYAIVRS